MAEISVMGGDWLGDPMEKRAFFIVLSLLASIFIPFASACTSPTNGSWINCTITFNATNPFASIQKTDTTNFSGIGLLIYLVILIGAFGFFKIVNNPPLLSFSYSAFMSLLIAIILVYFQWAQNSLVDIAISIMGIAIVLMFLFR